MNLDLHRETITNLSTSGRLSVDGVFECFTLEDPVREVTGVPVKDWKQFGKTAIPSGTYKISMHTSMRFKRDMPLLENVEGFSGILIHPGNTAADTEGCILVGTYREGSDVIRGSRAAFDNLFWKIKNALFEGEDVEITISNPI